jgi:hypothetical protein
MLQMLLAVGVIALLIAGMARFYLGRPPQSMVETEPDDVERRGDWDTGMLPMLLNGLALLALIIAMGQAHFTNS